MTTSARDIQQHLIYFMFQDSTSIEEEMGLAGAAADDADSEYILKICECEIVTGKTKHRSSYKESF